MSGYAAADTAAPAFAAASIAITASLVGLGALFTLTRRTFYAVLLLAFIGIAVACHMALLGFAYLAAFHAVMYVGAAVAFLLLTMAMVGEEPGPSVRHKPEAAVAAAITALVVGGPVVLAVAGTPLRPLPAEAWAEAAARLVTDYWFGLVAVLVALVSILIEAVAVARRGDGT